MKRRFFSLLIVFWAIPFAVVSVSYAGTTERVSVDSFGNQGNSYSHDASISADGRHVVFYSSASNLVPGYASGVYLHDKQTGVTSRVSGGGDPAISADGEHIAFISWHIRVYDRQTGTTELVSVDSNGNTANSRSYHPSISADGRYVAFTSLASNLVPDDTNGAEDIFVHD